MKTLIIAGIYQSNKNNVTYNVALYGQSIETPLATYIRHITLTVDNHDQLIHKCKEIYCKYFNTDLNNIVTIDNLFNQWNLNSLNS